MTVNLVAFAWKSTGTVICASTGTYLCLLVMATTRKVMRCGVKCLCSYFLPLMFCINKERGKESVIFNM